MMPNALAAFVGAFAALVVLAEITATNKLVRYFAALVVGILATLLLSWLVAFVVNLFARVHV